MEPFEDSQHLRVKLFLEIPIRIIFHSEAPMDAIFARANPLIGSLRSPRYFIGVGEEILK